MIFAVTFVDRVHGTVADWPCIRAVLHWSMYGTLPFNVKLPSTILRMHFHYVNYKTFFWYQEVVLRSIPYWLFLRNAHDWTLEAKQ